MRGYILRAFGPFDNLKLEDVADPVPGGGDILVDIRATSVNFADTLLVSGTYQFKPDFPFIPGKSPAGVVRAVGAAVEGFAPGDRVLALVQLGGFAERVVVKPSQCFKLPSNMSFIDAASMASVFDTAWVALRERAFVKSGEIVLILGGSSGVGLAATQLAKVFGGKVFLAVANTEKSELAVAAGADLVLDCSQANLKDGLREQILAATDGKGVDVIIDVLGGDVFDAAIRAMAWSGRSVVVGFAAGRVQSIKANYLLVKNISVSGMQISDYHRRRPQTIARCWHEIFSLYEAGTIKPLPTVVWPLSRCIEALLALRARSAPGRIVLQQVVS